jgi:two-component system, OmpR family, sensor histidine kinase ArlS
LKTTKKEIIVEVRDTGSGIPAEEMERIFQPFYRVDESRTTGGFGLGLSLTQRIIKLHKGSVHVTSAKDHETVFTIVLPSASELRSLIF